MKHGPTPIADLVEEMLAKGTADQEIVAAVAALEIAERSGRRVSRRGKRLPLEWAPSQGGLAYAIERGMSRHHVDLELEKFRNYWMAKSGQGALKVDWDATWRNWILSALERAHGGPPSIGLAGPRTFSRTRPSP